MYNRGYEPAIRKVEEGPVFRYRTTHQQRVARKRRLQIQYETHFIRLRALSKVIRIYLRKKLTYRKPGFSDF